LQRKGRIAKHRDLSSILIAGAAIRHSGVFENKDLSSRVEPEERDPRSREGSSIAAMVLGSGFFWTAMPCLL